MVFSNFSYIFILFLVVSYFVLELKTIW